MSSIYLRLADALLVTHVLVVLFNVLGLVIIWVGAWRGWRFVRNFYFRMAHLGCMGFVAAQTILGLECPLTTWETALRRKAGVTTGYEGGFIAHWLERLLFYDAPAGVFVAAYLGFFALVAATWFAVKPQLPSDRLPRK